MEKGKKGRKKRLALKFGVSILLMMSVILVSCSTRNDQIQSLAGAWQVEPFGETIMLPGSLDEAKLGTPTTDTAYGILSREYEYVGEAFYEREITIPEIWRDHEISLFLERVLWESAVFIDDSLCSTQDALGTPHIHPLGQMDPGKHQLKIRVDNDMIHNIGDKGHAYGDYMQSIWNGVVGRIELQARNRVHVEQIRLFPNIRESSLRFEARIKNPAGHHQDYQVSILESKSGKLVETFEFSSAKSLIDISIPIEQPLETWNEFNPFLYEFEFHIGTDPIIDQQSITFGFAEVSKNQHQVLINNEPIFLRGNLDCIHFPLTGYPSTQVSDWKKIFQAYKDFGLNHVRFHSWCPPEAAFIAADELGIYIQAEASLWIDWWMGVDMVERGRPEMNTKGHPQGIGKGDADADNFIRKEIQRVVDQYGNHPSFIMFCIGNELGSSDFNLMGAWMHAMKQYDPRRLYAASTARTITPFCDYSATHNVPKIGGVRQRMFNHKNWNYEDQYSQAHVPIIAHEIGQWPVYPDWNEIDKYTGVLKPRNLEQLENLAKKTGLWTQNEALTRASGQLSALLYKDEIESFLRTPSCAGYQLLSMQDYIGQGEAVIGWLDSFYEQKGNLDPSTAKQYMNPVVPLLALPAYTHIGGQQLTVEALLHQYGQNDLIQHLLTCQLLNEDQEIIWEMALPTTDYTKAQLHEAGTFQIPLPDVSLAQKYWLELSCSPTTGKSSRRSTFTNSWPIWVYPKNLPTLETDVIIARELDDEITQKLLDGAKVLLIADQLGDKDQTLAAAWKPLYWSASFFPGQSIETLGSLIQDDHPAFAHFPTDNFASWNWWELCTDAKAFDLGSAPVQLTPIVQPVSDFHYSRLLGSLFEAQVGQGKLLVSGYNISQDRDSITAVKHLRHSLLKYMSSDGFDPDAALPIAYLQQLFPQREMAQSKAPRGFEQAQLFVEAARNLTEPGNSNWSADLDHVLQQNQIEYVVTPEGCWKDEVGTAWFGKTMTISINLPDGAIGEVFLYCHDWNGLNRKGLIEIENREYLLGAHDGRGKWFSVSFMREDTQDGQVQIKITANNGPNIMVTQLAVFTE